MSYDKNDKNFSLKEFERDLKNGSRNRSTREAARILLDATPMSKNMKDQRILFSEHWDPSRDLTVEEYIMEKRKKKGLNPYASEFVPSNFNFKKSGRTLKKSKRVSRKSLKSIRKSKRVSRKSPKSIRKSKRVSRKSPKSIRKSKRVLRKSINRKSIRKSRRASRKMGKKMTCTNLLKKKIGINMDEFKDGRYKSREQAIAVAYSQVKSMNPLCGKYFKRN